MTGFDFSDDDEEEDEEEEEEELDPPPPPLLILPRRRVGTDGINGAGIILLMVEPSVENLCCSSTFNTAVAASYAPLCKSSHTRLLYMVMRTCWAMDGEWVAA